jgi:hypothetical protein
MEKSQFHGLLTYDIVFMLDRLLDLFIGFMNKEGQMEISLRNVIFKNFSSMFYLKLFYSISPIFLLDMR